MLAAVLRFWNLPGQGLLYWDEAKFALEGIRLKWLLSGAAAGSPLPGKTVGTAKPTHALLLAGMFAIFGVHDYAALYLNALAGVLQVAVAWLLAARLFGVRVAGAAALLLAASEYDVLYSRSALAEIDGNLLFIVGVLAWVSLRSRLRAAGSWSRIGPGVLLSIAFTTNYRLVVYIASIVLMDLVLTWREHQRSIPPPASAWPAGLAVVPHVSAWLAGLAVAPIVWQIVDIAARARGVVLFRNEITGEPAWYAQQALYQLHGGKQSVFRFDPVLYVQWYVLRQGILMSLATAGALVVAAWRRGFPWAAVAVPIALPFALYAFAPFIVPRNLAAALPFVSILVAASLQECASVFRSLWIRNPAFLLAVAALTVVGTSMSWRLTSTRSGFARVATFLHLHGGKALTTTEIMVFYLDGDGSGCRTFALPTTLPGLAWRRFQGFQYAVAERHQSSVTAYVRAHARKALRVEATGPIGIGENPISSENGNPPQGNGHPELVTVYRLKGLPLPPPRPAGVGTCQRDRPI